jgi:hypothetical protein
MPMERDLTPPLMLTSFALFWVLMFTIGSQVAVGFAVLYTVFAIVLRDR